MYRSEELRLFLRRERWQQWVQSPSNMRKQLAIRFRRLVPLNSRETYQTTQADAKYSRFLCDRCAETDRWKQHCRNAKTNYTNYRKIPLHWIHLPKREVTKLYKIISEHLHHGDFHRSCTASLTFLNILHSFSHSSSLHLSNFHHQCFNISAICSWNLSYQNIIMD